MIIGYEIKLNTIEKVKKFTSVIGTFENDIPTGTLTYYKAAGNTFRTTWSNGSCIKIEET